MSHPFPQQLLGAMEDPNGRVCLSCGESIAHLRADARVCGGTCRQRLRRGHVFQPRPVTRGRLCPCDWHLLDRDEDGDLYCVKTGRLVPRVGDRLITNRPPARARQASRIHRPEAYRNWLAIRAAA